MKRIWKISVLLAVVAALSVAVVGTAAAQGPGPEDPGPPLGEPGAMGIWNGHWEVFDAVAEALSLAPVNLFTELHTGKTLQQVAEDHGVDLATVQAAVQSARQEQQRARIEQAVEDGKLTRAQADWMLQGLELGFGPMGRGLRQGPGRLPATQ